MAELSKKNFIGRLYTKDEEKRIYVTPLINKENISNGFIDIRLGTEFILTKRTKFSIIDFTQSKNKIASDIKKYQEKISINLKDKLILHPNQFILGCTLEYIKLPYDILAYIIGRSSWGRLGLIIATATLINPGFAGVITLELTNVGDVPINLYPGLRIAQISFHICDFDTDKGKGTKGKYFGSTSPSFSKIHLDTDLDIIRKKKNRKK